jgi:hypothetical protein
MSIEARIQEAFPGKENASLRIALYTIAWAWEPSGQLDEAMYERLFNIVLRARNVVGYDMTVFVQALREGARQWLELAARFEDAARRIELAQLEEREERSKDRRGL